MSVACWNAPGHGSCCLNTDGAAKFSAGVAGCGGLIRNDKGLWFNGFGKQIRIVSAYISIL